MKVNARLEGEKGLQERRREREKDMQKGKGKARNNINTHFQTRTDLNPLTEVAAL